MTKLRVSSERYYDVEVDLNSAQLDSDLLLFVKKKSGNLSYMQDPEALRSLQIQTSSRSFGTSRHDSTSYIADIELVKSFTQDPKLLAYAKYLCATLRAAHGPSSKQSHNGISFVGSPEEFYAHVFHQSLVQQKPESILLHLSLHNWVTSVARKPWTVGIIWNLRLLRSYYETRHRLFIDSSKVDLLSLHFVAMLCEYLDRFFSHCGNSDPSSISDHEGQLNYGDLSSRELLGPFLVWYNVPGLTLNN